MEKQLEVRLNRTPAFTETWYEGSVIYDGETYQYWLIDPNHSDYEPELRWFFHKVPKEVRGMSGKIVDFFIENKKKNDSTDSPRDNEPV
jgi:hypothetical protein